MARNVDQGGYGKTRRAIIMLAENVVRDKGMLRGSRVKSGWFQRFMERHPDLSLRKGDATVNVRMDCLNSETMKAYFNLLNDVLDKNELMDSPAQIYNVDETGMPLDHRPPKIITKKGQKKIRYRTTRNKYQITVIGCISATGQAIPPFVIFDAKSLNVEWTVGEVPGTTYGLSDKGWVDTELFRGWLIDHFLKNAVSGRSLFLLLDGHSSHYQPICLPPHTTHESQSLDIGVFGPLKQNWQLVCHEYIQKKPGKLVTKYQFSGLLNKAWMKTMTPSNICSGFRTCGVYPFNPDAIDCGIDFEGRASHNEHNDDNDKDNSCGFDDSNNSDDHDEFSAETLARFQKRYDKGYDLYDEEYLRWLELNHPSNLPADRSLLGSTPSTPSAVDSFISVEPLLESSENGMLNP